MTGRYKLGLIGWPLSRSLSPHLHMAAFNVCSLGGDYCLYPFPPFPDGRTEMVNLLKSMRGGELDGLNVTIPHKQTIIPLLDELTPAAMEIGSVNTIIRSGNRLVGENTDAPGFLQDIEPRLSLANPGEALVLGAGGGARAIAYTLASHSWQVYVAARNPAQAQILVAGFAHLAPSPIFLPCPLAEDASEIFVRNVQLLVNATPLGMPPFEQLSPWPKDIPLPQDCFVYDLVYDPPESLFLKQARQQGLMAANGSGMLVNQAALAFVAWTNLPKDKLPLIRNAMHTAISTPTGPP